MAFRQGIASSRPPPPSLAMRPFSADGSEVGHHHTLSYPDFSSPLVLPPSVLPHETVSVLPTPMSPARTPVNSPGELPCFSPAFRLHPHRTAPRLLIPDACANSTGANLIPFPTFSHGRQHGGVALSPPVTTLHTWSISSSPLRATEGWERGSIF
jgi:hypothetical protein